jgi:hypothetical protein
VKALLGAAVNADLQERIRGDLIRRALEEDSLKEQRREDTLCIRDTLEALEEITALNREELESLADEVTRAYSRKEDTFFSIKHQLLLTSAVVGFILCVPILGIWFF